MSLRASVPTCDFGVALVVGLNRVETRTAFVWIQSDLVSDGNDLFDRWILLVSTGKNVGEGLTRNNCTGVNV